MISPASAYEIVPCAVVPPLPAGIGVAEVVLVAVLPMLMLTAAIGPLGVPVPVALTVAPTMRSLLEGVIAVELVNVTGTRPYGEPVCIVIFPGSIDVIAP